MTEYLVVHKMKQFSAISIEPPGKVYNHPTECWAIRSGSQFIFARVKMAKLLDKFYFGGTYEKIAHYFVPYEELCAVVETYMGPSDRKRYEASRVNEGEFPKWVTAAPALIQGTFSTATLILARSIRLLLVVIIVPFVLRWFNKRNP